jgi:hypothetical protein
MEANVKKHKCKSLMVSSLCAHIHMEMVQKKLYMG